MIIMKHKQVIAGLLSMMVLASIIVPFESRTANAATASLSTVNNLFKPTVLQNVKLTTKSYLEVNDVQFYHVANEKYVYYTITVHNKDTNILNMMDYWFNIQSNTGEKYSVQVMGLDNKTNNLISPNTSRTLKVYSKVNSKLNYTNLSLNVIKWDFSVSGFEKVIGSVKAPKTYSNVTPVGKDRMINKDGSNLLTTVSALQLVEVGDKTEASLSIYYTNKSDSEVTLNTYKYYLRTISNSYYVLEPEVAEIKLLPGEKKKINYHAKLPLNMYKKTYQLFIAEETGGENKIELPVGYYGLMLRSQANTITEVDKVNTLSIEGQSVQSKLMNTMIDSNTEYHNITISYQLENISKQPVKLPNYQYYLSTVNKAMYPLETTSTEETLLPGMKKEIVMSTSIPANLSLSNMKMLLKKTPEDGKNNDYLIAQYKIPQSTPISENGKTTYINKQGVYEVSVGNFERLPWDTNDIVNATITVKNIGKETQPMPELAATTWLSGVKIDSEKINILQVQETLGLQPGESTKLILTTKVSDQAYFENAKVQLSEVVDDKPVSTIGNFIVTAADSILPTYITGSTANYTMEQPGIEAQLRVLESNTYTTDSSNVVETLSTYRNSGKRYSKLPSVQAYYFTEDKVYIPAKVTVIENEVGPGSANLISISATIPKQYTAKDLKLLVGQGIAQGKYITGSEVPDSYVNAAILGLAEEDTTIDNLFAPQEIRPYTFKFNKISANLIGETQVRFNFNYNLTEYKPFDNILNKHNLVIEIVYNGKKFNKSYEVGKDIIVGSEISESILIDDMEMLGVANSGFTMNLYDEVNGARKLLITHRVYNFEG